MFLLANLYQPNRSTVYQARSFYGVHKVVDIEGGRFRVLFHGTTAHGGQQLLADDGSKLQGRPIPLTYYYPGGPYSQAIDAIRERAGGILGHVGLVGLGAGIFTCHPAYGRWDLYELDPLVIHIAQQDKLFTALSQCAPAEPIIAGDARLTLRKAPPGYDFLVLDAFTSDAVAVHLITAEAVKLYADSGAARRHRVQYLQSKPGACERRGRIGGGERHGDDRQAGHGAARQAANAETQCRDRLGRQVLRRFWSLERRPVVEACGSHSGSAHVDRRLRKPRQFLGPEARRTCDAIGALIGPARCRFVSPEAYFAIGLKSRNTMSGALVLWRDGTSRPVQSSAAVARLNCITGSSRQS